MFSVESLFSDFIFSLTNITPAQVIDVGLVTIIFYLLLHLLRRSRATLLLRGTLVLIALFFIFTVLPLPTFDYLLQVLLIVTLIALPIIFQPELRHLLEELGRSVGSVTLHRIAAESTLKPLVRAVDNLSENKTGALIVLEGNDELSDIAETGVPVGSEVTSELLQTMFYDGTPLHDGASIIRGNRLVAAGCVLPVSNRQIYDGQRRLGTRHRAAVGLTETSDALVLVVSEETGDVSVARAGRLRFGLDKTELREQVHSFYRPEPARSDFSLRRALAQIKASWSRGRPRFELQDLISSLSLLAVALLLALGAWSWVTQETNPIGQRTIRGIPLQVRDVPEGMQLLSAPPEEVTAQVKSNQDILSTLGPNSLQASVSLAGLEPGLHRAKVTVESSVEPVGIEAVEPAELDLQLARTISKSVEVQVVLAGEASLSPVFTIGDNPRVVPSEVVVTGAAPQVETVDHIEAEVPVSSATGSEETMYPLMAVDEQGVTVTEVTIRPEQVQVELDVTRREDARDVGIQVVTEGVLPEGYRLVRLDATPSRATLLGDPAQLATVGSVVSTFPVDLSQAVDTFTVQVALDLPVGLNAVNKEGETVRSALVRVEVAPRQGHRAFSRPVEILGSAGLTLTVSPASVDMTLNGPVPVLDEIATEPGLVRIVVDAGDLADLDPGETIMVTPQVIGPEGIRVQLVPEQVQVVAVSNQ